jgi:CxxC motif-containing protein (DUF1111 family)
LHVLDEDELLLRRHEPQERGGHSIHQRAYFVQKKRRGRPVVRRFGKRRQKPGYPPIVTRRSGGND